MKKIIVIGITILCVGLLSGCIVESENLEGKTFRVKGILIRHDYCNSFFDVPSSIDIFLLQLNTSETEHIEVININSENDNYTLDELDIILDYYERYTIEITYHYSKTSKRFRYCDTIKV